MPSKYRVTTEAGTFEVTTEEGDDPRAHMTLDQRQGNTSLRKPAGHVDPPFPDTGIMGALFTPIRGVQQAAKGALRLTSPGEGETRGGISDIMQGIMKALSPYAIAPVVLNPVAALGGAAGGYLGSKGGDVVADAVDAAPGTRELLQTGGGIVGGAAGALGAPKAVAAVKSVGQSLQTAKQLIQSNPELIRDIVGLVSPRASHVVGLAIKGKNIADKIGAAMENSEPAPEITTAPKVATAHGHPIQLLDKISSGMGGPKFNSLEPAGQATVIKVANQLATQEASSATPPPILTAPPVGSSIPPGTTSTLQTQPIPIRSVPPPPAANTGGAYVDELLAKLKTKLERESGKTFDEIFGEPDPEVRFEEGHADSPIIDSSKRKSYSTAPVANPHMIESANLKPAARKAMTEGVEGTPKTGPKSLAQNPKALKIAQQLLDELTKSKVAK